MINWLSDDLDFSHWDNKLGPEGVGGVTWLFVMLMLATSVFLKHWHWYIQLWTIQPITGEV